MPLSGDIGQIDRMASRLAAVERSMPEITRAAGDEIHGVVAKQLGGRQAPKGDPWAAKKGGGSLSTMASHVTVVARDGKIRERTDKIGSYHHRGTFTKWPAVRMPARPITPKGALLPPWREALDAAVANVLDREFGGAL